MDDKSWLTEFTITPAIRHAVEVLRTAIPRWGDIPAGGEALTVMREFDAMSAESSRVVDEFEGTMEYDEFTLTAEHEEAAKLLLAAIAYHAFLIEQAYEEADESTRERQSHLAWKYLVADWLRATASRKTCAES